MVKEGPNNALLPRQIASFPSPFFQDPEADREDAHLGCPQSHRNTEPALVAQARIVDAAVAEDSGGPLAIQCSHLATSVQAMPSEASCQEGQAAPTAGLQPLSPSPAIYEGSADGNDWPSDAGEVQSNMERKLIALGLLSPTKSRELAAAACLTSDARGRAECKLHIPGGLQELHGRSLQQSKVLAAAFSACGRLELDV